MYQASYTSPPPQPCTSPPTDPYGTSPIFISPRQPHSGAFSPPPVAPAAKGFSPMPSSQSRYNQYSPSQQYSRSNPNRYTASPSYPQQPQQLPPARHKGTLAPGKIIQVGIHSVRIERYLSEGGYAHVYLTTSEEPIYPPIKGEKKGRWGEKGYRQHCLKRIAFEDEAVWADVKKEIEVMKALPPNPHLTQYLGSAHSRSPNGSHEVFILMEFCAGGGIIDLLNKRLRDRLKEIEILNIFTDVCEAVAAMHALSRPLLHRDLKIENVLSQPTSSPPAPERPTPLLFKLCDFGSTTYPASRPPSTKLEVDSLSLDLNKHTTLQYRSPEMVEPMLGWAVGLPSDVWALGVLLYKLCYYTTPFEEHGTLAIVNAKYTFPQYPVYSPRLQHLIAAMLVEQPIRRPSIFEVLKMAHGMSGTKPEVNYPSPSRSIPAFAQPAQPSMPKATAFSSNLLDFTSSTSNHDSQIRQAPLVPSVQPGRRGRPTREPSRSQLPSSKFPEMPQPPVLHHPKPPNVADNLASAAPLLQVTGEAKETQSSPKPPQNLDTFGMPSIPIATPKSEEGFEDSFGARVSRFGANLQRPSSGLDPSLRGIRSTSISASQPKSGLATSSSYNFPTSFEASKGISPAPTAKRTLDPSSSIPDGELSFETRFPSIEALSSGDAFSPPLPTAAPTSRPQSNQPQTLISPITCPPTKRPKSGPRQQSIMGSLTGGETLSDHQASSSKADRAPQPHSTHVTGTAFKSIQGGMLSPPTAQSQTGYFDLTSQNGRASPATAAGATKSPMPQDLMTGDESGELLMASMRPAMSTMTSANGIRLRPKSMGQPPASGSQSGESRPLLAHVNSSKSNDNTQPQRPPLKGMQVEEIVTSPDAKSPEKVKPDSSDEEAGPESASAIYRRPDFPSQGASALPAADGKWAAPKAGQSGKEKERSPSKLPSKAATTPLPVENSKERPAARRLPTTERNRPQSMYVTTTSGPSQSGTDASVPQSAEPQRPSHGRQGSITDMVSRFESMNSPVTPTANGSSNGLSRKPWVAAKPAALRKLTTEVISQSPSFMLPKKIEGPVTVAPKPVQYGQTPAPAGFSRSSSGRSFPITMPTPSAKPSVSATADHVEPNAAVRRNDPKSPKSSEAQDSPEKQQPVNLLIQRWNRGGMSKPQSQPKRGNYV